MSSPHVWSRSPKQTDRKTQSVNTQHQIWFKFSSRFSVFEGFEGSFSMWKVKQAFACCGHDHREDFSLPVLARIWTGSLQKGNSFRYSTTGQQTDVKTHLWPAAPLASRLCWKLNDSFLNANLHFRLSVCVCVCVHLHACHRVFLRQ